jgi:hypothetical protein
MRTSCSTTSTLPTKPFSASDGYTSLVMHATRPNSTPPSQLVNG